MRNARGAIAWARPATSLAALFVLISLVAPSKSEAATWPGYAAPKFSIMATRQQPTNGPSWDQEPDNDLGAVTDHSSPVITQLTPGGPTVAIVGARDGCVYAYTFNPSGADMYSKLDYLPGFPTCVGAMINSSPTVADLDGDGTKEIVFGAGKLYQPGEYGRSQAPNGGIWALSADGSNYWGGGPTSTNHRHVQVNDGVFTTPAVGDIDDDGRPDIVWGDFEMNVRAINRDGSNKWSVYIADTVWSSPALTTIPGTNKLATVIGTDLGGGNEAGHLGCPQYYSQPGDGYYLTRGFLLALDEGGNVMSGFPKCLDTPIWSTPTLTDLDRDGRIDAVFATNNYFENGAVVGRSDRVYAIDLWWPGQAMHFLPGWPVSTPGARAKSWQTVGIADMNGDGSNEVALGNTYDCPEGHNSGWECGAMFVFAASGGAPLWGRNGEYGNRTMMSSPVMADVNGDGLPEAIFGGGDWRIHALDYGGNFVGEFYAGCSSEQPLLCNAGRQFRNSVAVGDMNGDGALDIFAAGGTHPDVLGGPDKTSQVWLLATPQPTTLATTRFFKRDEARQSNEVAAPGVVNLGQVTNLAGTPGDGKVRLTWQMPPDPDVTGATLVRKVGSCPAWKGDGAVVSDGTGGSHLDTGLLNGAVYSYSAFAHDAEGNYAPRDCVTVEPKPPPSPATPLTARPDEKQVSLFWQNPADGNYVGTRLVRKPGSAPPIGPADGTTVYDGRATTYTDVGLVSAGAYSYAAFTHNALGESAGQSDAATLTGPHLGPPIASYLAEGYTGGPSLASAEYLTLSNQNDADASVTVTFMFEDGPPAEKSYQVASRTRKTVSVNSEVGSGRSTAARISSRSGPGLVVERPMYFSGNAGGPITDGGDDAISVPNPSDEWHFAEGYTGPGFAEWLTMLNPSGEAVAIVNATYHFEESPPITKQHAISPLSRATINVADDIGGPGRDVSVSLAVSSGPPIVAERAEFFAADPGLGAPVTGGHVHAGIAAPASDFDFAEGYTGDGFVEYLTLENSGDQVADLDITYMFGPNRGPNVVPHSVPPHSRRTVRVNDEAGPGEEVAIHVATSQSTPISVERPEYFIGDPGAGGYVDGGHDVVGATHLSTEYGFAEGYTGNGFVEYLTVSNPSAAAAGFSATYIFSDGSPPLQRHYSVAASSRRTLRVNDEVGGGREVSVHVATDPGSTILVERPIYFDADPGLGLFVNGGHDVIGMQVGG